MARRYLLDFATVYWTPADGGWVYNWFCVDHVDYEVNPRRPDERLTRYLRRWLTESRGVEEFPTDPLVRENWEESATS